MNVDWPTVRTLVANDLRLLLRSKRTLFASVVLPLLVWPVMLYMTNLANQRQEVRAETAVYSYYLSGSERFRAESLLEAAKNLGSQSDGDHGDGETDADPVSFQFEELDEESQPEGFDPNSFDPERAVEEGSLDLWIEAVRHRDLPQEPESENTESDGQPPGEQLAGSDFEDGSAPVSGLLSGNRDREIDGDTLALRVRYRGDHDTSERAYASLTRTLSRTRKALRQDLLSDRGFTVENDELGRINFSDVASAAQSSGLRLGRFLTALLLMFLVSGGSIAAMDSLAGEKERGTLETLLTTAASRLEIVSAKSLAILIVALTIAAVQILDLLLFVGLGLIPIPEGFTVPITAPLALLLLFLFLPLAAVVSSLLLLVSGYARTYKEAQLLFFPLFLLIVMPAMVVILPGIKLRSPIALLPVSNASVAVKEILSGSFDWPMIGVAWMVNAAVALLLARVSVKALSSERLVTANDFDDADLYGGPRLFGRYVLQWYAALWAVFLVWQLNAGTTLDMRVVLSINMALLVGTALYLVRRYDLDFLEAVPLNLPKPVVWPAVLIGAPAGLFATVVIGNLWSRFFDIPEEVLERFSEELITPDLSIASALFFFAVLPGVCEELTFRGVLLYGLEQRRKKWVSVLLCGVIFGIFHVSLFRLAPTAFLGILLATITLRTGSILPAMLWHALHNGTAFFLDRQSEILESLEGPVIWIVAYVVLALALGIIAKYGTRTSDPIAPGT